MHPINPFEASPLEVTESQAVKQRFRWRIIPVTFLALMTIMATFATIFHFGVIGYANIMGNAPEGWHEEYEATFLRGGMISFLQIPLLGFGAYCLWTARWRMSALLLLPAFLLRSVVAWLLP